MKTNEVKDVYFEWLIGLVCDGKYAKRVYYRRLLRWLHETEFTYSLPMDANRAEDGVQMRSRFADDYSSYDIRNFLNDDAPCSLLEMMVAISVRCEEQIMKDIDKGNRTGEWFWGMITNLGLDPMTDSGFDPEYVERVVDRLLHREYGSHGEGGLFSVRRRPEDLRTIDIWYQMCWHLTEISR